MVNPQFKSGKPTMFICGNDEAAKLTVSGILDQFGWETADMGKAEAARAIEPLCMLRCIPGFLHNQWVHAFKLLVYALLVPIAGWVLLAGTRELRPIPSIR
jgi:8-hydroxy-5-deazaflavin:NADPH oxidoreductase